MEMHWSECFRSSVDCKIAQAAAEAAYLAAFQQAKEEHFAPAVAKVAAKARFAEYLERGSAQRVAEQAEEVEQVGQAELAAKEQVSAAERAAVNLVAEAIALSQ